MDLLFAATARQLHKTQSGISARPRTLEERLATRLLARTSRPVALTRDGETFRVHARRILQLQREAVSVPGTGNGGVIRFGVPEDYAEARLPALPGRFPELHPCVRLHIHCRMSRELPESWRTLGVEDGLPPLPSAELELHRSPSFQHPAGDDLVALLRDLVVPVSA